MTDNQQIPDLPEDNLFSRMENSAPDLPPAKFQRSGVNVVISGVCGGIAEYSNSDPGNVRLIALLSLLLGGWSIVVYILLALLVPSDHNPPPLPAEEQERIQRVNFKTVFSGLLILAGFYFALQFIGVIHSSSFFILPNRFIFPLIAAGIGILVLRKPASDFSHISATPPEIFNRSGSDRMILGVCGGLGVYLQIDSSAVRIIFILATLLTLGFFASIYLILGIWSHLASPEYHE